MRVFVVSIATCCIVFLGVVNGFGEEEKSPKGTDVFGLHVYGGASFAVNSDAASYVEHNAEFLEEAENGKISSDEKAMDTAIGYHAGVEPRFFYKNIGFGVAGEYYKYRETTVVKEMDFGHLRIAYDLKIYSVVGTLYYRTDVFESLFGNENSDYRLVFGLGGGKYFGTLTLRDPVYSSSDSYRDFSSKDYKGETYGFHGLASVQLLPMEYFTLSLTISGRYATINKLESSDNQTARYNGSTMEAGATGASILLGAGLVL